MMELAHLHELLLGVMADANYKQAFEAAEPLLEDLAKRADKEAHPVEQMVVGLYGWLGVADAQGDRQCRNGVRHGGASELGQRPGQRPSQGLLRQVIGGGESSSNPC